MILLLWATLHGRLLLVILGCLHRRLGIVMWSRLMHRMHLLVVVRIPIRCIMLGILGHDRAHLLRIILRIARMRSHMGWHRGIRAIMTSLARLHGHLLPIGHVILVHDVLCPRYWTWQSSLPGASSHCQKVDGKSAEIQAGCERP